MGICHNIYVFRAALKTGLVNLMESKYFPENILIIYCAVSTMTTKKFALNSNPIANMLIIVSTNKV